MKNKIKFGFMYDLRNPAPWRKPWSSFYGEALDFIEWTEKVGFDSAWISEHHGWDDGYIPSPLVVTSAIAARTKRIAIGTGIALAPLYHPVRFAEDCAIIDIISGGRLELGLGVGYRRKEMEAYGVNFARRGKITDELLQIVRRLWAGETVDFESESFKLKGATVQPRPVRGNIPIYIGGFSQKALQRVINYGDGFFGDLEAYQAFKEAMEIAGKDCDSTPFSTMDVFLFVARDPEKAIDEIAPHVLYMNNAYAEGLAEDQNKFDITNDNSRLLPMTLDDFKKSGRLQVLTPEHAINYIKDKLTKAPIDNLMITPPAGYPLSKFVENAELFATEVIPAFR
jgi:probable F420-dependent oxidoreductase